MQITKRKAVKSMVALLTCLHCTMWVANLNAQTLVQNQSGDHGDHYYMFWKDVGTVDFTLHQGAHFSVTWQNNINNWIGGIGWRPGGPGAVHYQGIYSPDENANSYLALYGSTTDRYFEYYIIDSYGYFNPGNAAESAFVGSFTSDGGIYDVYHWQSWALDSEQRKHYRYYSIKQDKKGFGAVSGTITAANHFSAWQSMGLRLEDPIDFMIMAIEGYQSGGSAELTVSEAEPNTCGFSGNMPICCGVAADEDGDGYGELANGDQCQVTEASVGWHPPNSDDVVAAINLGGPGEPVMADGIWYTPNTYLQGRVYRNGGGNIAGGGGNALYETAATGNIAIDIPINEPQKLAIELTAVEYFLKEAGISIFDIIIEGETIFEDLDIYAEVGHKILWKPAPIEIEVTDGELNIQVMGTSGGSELSSVLVRKVATETSPANRSSSSSSSSNPKPVAGSFNIYILLLIASLAGVVRSRITHSCPRAIGLCP